MIYKISAEVSLVNKLTFRANFPQHFQHFRIHLYFQILKCSLGGPRAAFLFFSAANFHFES